MLRILLKPDPQYSASPWFFCNYVPCHKQRNSPFPISSFRPFLKRLRCFSSHPVPAVSHLHGLSQLAKSGLCRTLSTPGKAPVWSHGLLRAYNLHLAPIPPPMNNFSSHPPLKYCHNFPSQMIYYQCFTDMNNFMLQIMRPHAISWEASHCCQNNLSVCTQMNTPLSLNNSNYSQDQCW